LFVVTFFGSLLGLAADLSDASGLAQPFLEVVDPAPEVRIVGSSTVLGEGIPMASDWQQEFEADKSWQTRIPLIGKVDRTVTVNIQGVGTLEDCQRAVVGQVNLLAASEPIPCYDQLVAQGINVQGMAEIGYDVVAFVTDINNKVPEVDKREMISILNGSITNWAEVGGDSQPIRVLARRGSGTTELVLDRFTGSAEFRPHFIECQSNGQCLDLA
jgi:ABC-type phosphate transport system substrate-binding protein